MAKQSEVKIKIDDLEVVKNKLRKIAEGAYRRGYDEGYENSENGVEQDSLKSFNIMNDKLFSPDDQA